jgi:hypothetical protein
MAVVDRPESGPVRLKKIIRFLNAGQGIVARLSTIAPGALSVRR